MHLHRSFKPQNCKTQLGLAMSRMKVLRNKKVSVVNQMKREVAQLLESGQDQHARIRIEHVIREEKMMAAYDLLDIYCELVMTRLQMVETQKICPIDLKEAVSSLIFASPRCADIPELGKIFKQFSAKYGKDFVNSALELRPDCGVSPLLVDKLSTKTPDIETKVKVLTSIASENGIKWEPKSFEESLPRPNGGFGNSFERSSNFTVDTGKTEVVSQISRSHESVVKATTANKMMTSSASISFGTKLQGPTSFESASEFARESTKPDAISPPSQMHGVEKAPVVNDAGNFVKSSESTSAGSTNAKVVQDKPKRTASIMSGKGHEEQGIDTYSKEEVTVARREKWGMGFKDAASAAEAAAESAERASMAARAAAQLAGDANDPMRHYTYDERKPEAPESLKFKTKPSSQEQIQMPSYETEEMHRTNLGSDDECKGAMNDRSGVAYCSEGTEQNIPRRINSSSMRFGIQHETAKNNQDKEDIRMGVDVHEESETEVRYAFHSYDGKRSEEGTEKAHGHEDMLGSESRQSSFHGDSGPTFDEDSLYNGDYVDFDNLGNNEESPSFRNQGCRSSDFSSFVKPCPLQQKSDSISNDNSSLQAHSLKKSYIDEITDDNRKDSLPSPSYDSDPEERKEVDCIDLLSHQTENDSVHSENLDYSNYESEQVLKIENLTGGLKGRLRRPPYTVSSEKTLASKETSPMASSRIKKTDHSISYFETGGKPYDQALNRKNVFQKTSLASSSDSDSSEVENLQPYDSPIISEKQKFDPGTPKTSQESLYQRAQKRTTEEPLRATVLNSGPKTRAGKVNPSLLLHKTLGGTSPATEAAARHEMPPNSESSTKWDVLDEESQVRESDSRQSIHYSGPSNGDGDDSQSYQSYAMSGTKTIIKKSRRTRGPTKSANINILSKSPERAELPAIQRKSQADVLDMSGNSKFAPRKPQGGITSDTSEGVLPFRTKQLEKPGTNRVSIFQPPTSWEKNMSDDDDSESSSQEADEDSKPFQVNLAQTSYPRRTQRINSPTVSSSSRYSRKAAPPTSSPSDSPKTSNLEKEAPKSTTSTSRGELERNLSIENKERAKHIHPKLPDSDKLLAHFQALKSNVRK